MLHANSTQGHLRKISTDIPSELYHVPTNIPMQKMNCHAIGLKYE